jgi:two-component system, chemotaxis family, sensor kinase CheA
MSLSARIREQLISSFRAELAEHVQTMMSGLLAIEQGLAGSGAALESQPSLDDTFRAAHSLKGAARAVGITVIEELAHSLESALDGLRKQTLQPSPELFNACYHTIDAIQAVQTAFEGGATTPPLQALQALAELGPFIQPGHTQAEPGQTAVTPPSRPVQQIKLLPRRIARHKRTYRPLKVRRLSLRDRAALHRLLASSPAL